MSAQAGDTGTQGADAAARTADALGQIARLEQRLTRHDLALEGRRISWRQLGEGSPLVLLHGGHGSWLHWLRNIEPWSARYAVWVPDMPGYGDSEGAAAPGLEGIVAALDASLDILLGRRTPIALAGFSFGGLVAATLAARRPGVAQLALLGPAGHGSERRPRGPLRDWRDLPVDSAPWREAMRHNLLMHMLHDPECADELALQIHGRSCLGTRFHSKSISRASGLGAALAAYGGPLLQIWGEHDVTAVPTQVAQALADRRPGAQTRLVAGAGHWVQYEGADAVNAQVLDWLANCPTQQAR